jgi:hypothetical protein
MQVEGGDQIRFEGERTGGNVTSGAAVRGGYEVMGGLSGLA